MAREVRATLTDQQFEALMAMAQRLRWNQQQTASELLARAIGEWGNARIVVDGPLARIGRVFSGKPAEHPDAHDGLKQQERKADGGLDEDAVRSRHASAKPF